MTVEVKKHEEEPKLKQKHVYYKILSWDKRNFINNDTLLIKKDEFSDINEHYLYKRERGTDTIFNQEDKEFILKQFSAIKDTVWHEKFSHSKLLTNKKQRRPNRYYYSIPLFSVDKKFVIIHKLYYCGSICAYGGYYVYKRIDSKNWKYITSVNTWIS
jgi:hypothetical protein